MQGLTIRNAREADIPSAQSLARRVIAACYPAFLGSDAVAAFLDGGQADREFLHHRDDLHLLLRGESITGLAICFDDFVHLMLVDPRFQRAGHGSRLLAWCEGKIRSRGHSVARLETFAANTPAVRFYGKNGWAEVDRDGPQAGPFARVRLEKAMH